VDDNGIENHPDLLDPDWRRHAETEAWTELRRNRRRARSGKRIAWTAGVLLVLLTGGFGVYRWGTTTSDHYDSSAGSAVPATTTAPSVLPDIARVDLSRPFNDTPAQAWAESVDGLTVPAAAKTGSFSVAQVQDAYDKVKRLIAAAHLDRRMLEGRDTSAYLAMLSPNEQTRLRPILANRGTSDFAGYVTLVADGYHLLPAAPRITGRLSVRPGDAGELIVHAEYVLGYAFDPGSFGPLTTPAEIDAFDRYAEDYSILTSPPYRKGDSGVALSSGSGFMYEIGCKASKAGYLAPEYSNAETATGSTPSNEAAVFDVNQPMPTDDNCQ